MPRTKGGPTGRTDISVPQRSPSRNAKRKRAERDNRGKGMVGSCPESTARCCTTGGYLSIRLGCGLTNCGARLEGLRRPRQSGERTELGKERRDGMQQQHASYKPSRLRWRTPERRLPENGEYGLEIAALRVLRYQFERVRRQYGSLDPFHLLQYPGTASRGPPGFFINFAAADWASLSERHMAMNRLISEGNLLFRLQTEQTFASTMDI